ncbi:MAG: RluA family pseudouridine synthase [Akkermansiaceae bacterium]
MHLIVSKKHDRLDTYLAEKIDDLSRSRIQSLIREQHILLNGIPAKPRDSINSGDEISITIPQTVPAEANPEKIPLTILFEDDDIVVIDKAHGMVVHPAPGNYEGTLVNALLYHCRGQLSGIGGVERPGIVHRLDKDTSGCMVVAKTDSAHQSLVTQFSERTTMEKIYLAISNGIPSTSRETIFTHIGRHPVNRQKMAVVNPPGGKTAITDYEILESDSASNTALILCHLHTGRTHQIRVHLHHIGTPILGDPIYGKKQGYPTSRLLLHAWKLSFQHPMKKIKVSFTAPPPTEFKYWLELGNKVT